MRVRYVVKRNGRYWFTFTKNTYEGVQRRILSARMQGYTVTTTGINARFNARAHPSRLGT